MALEDIIKAVVVADRDTLGKVARVLRHEDEARPAEGGDPDLRLVTQGEAGRRLGVSRTTVWRLMRDGQLEGVAVRGKVRVRLASVLAFVRGGGKGARAAKGGEG